MSTEIPRSLMRRFAREQRADAVQTEVLIWSAIRNRRCVGAKFWRQVVLGNCVADFVCSERRLVVEIDGPSHEGEDGKAGDSKRDEWLREEGFRTSRLSNELVIGATELAVARIRAALAK
jgi:very-short-patch-repair endonuclease